MSTLLNLSGKIDPQTVTVFEIVGCVIAEPGMPYVVAGATARDLVLHYGHGVAIRRATADIGYSLCPGLDRGYHSCTGWSGTRSMKEFIAIPEEPRRLVCTDAGVQLNQ